MALKIRYGGFSIGTFNGNTATCPQLGVWPGFDPLLLPAIDTVYNSFTELQTACAAAFFGTGLTYTRTGTEYRYWLPGADTTVYDTALTEDWPVFLALTLDGLYQDRRDACADDFPLSPSGRGRILYSPYAIRQGPGDTGNIVTQDPDYEAPILSVVVFDDAAINCPPGYTLTTTSTPLETTLRTTFATEDNGGIVASGERSSILVGVSPLTSPPTGLVTVATGTVLDVDGITIEPTGPVTMYVLDSMGIRVLRDDTGNFATAFGLPSDPQSTYTIEDGSVVLLEYWADDGGGGVTLELGTWEYTIPATIPASSSFCAFSEVVPPGPEFGIPDAARFPPDGGAPVDVDTNLPLYPDAEVDFPILGGLPIGQTPAEVLRSTRLWGGPATSVANRFFETVQTVLANLVDKDETSVIRGNINLNGHRLVNLQRFSTDKPQGLITRE